MTTYTAGSLFSGIGGIDLAAALAGFDVLFQVEIDGFCRKVLAKHADEYWSHATQFTDVRTVGRHNLPAVDILFGGFPCQDVSVAGARRGIQEGTRSGLWLEFRRIIGELRPRVVLLENVPGILTRDGSGVIADLAALGYVGQWGIVSAADTGAPHKRERWFCVGYTQRRRGYVNIQGDERNPHCHKIGYSATLEPKRDYQQLRTRRSDQIMGNSASIRRHQHTTQRRIIGTRQDTGGVCQPTGTGHEKVNAEYTGLQGRESDSSSGYQTNAACVSSRPNPRRKPEPRLGGTSHGLPGRLDFPGYPAAPGESPFPYEPPRTTGTRQKTRAARIKALGNAVVPQVVYPLLYTIREYLEREDTL